MNKEHYIFGYINPELIHGKSEENKYVSRNKTLIEKHKELLSLLLVFVLIFLGALALILFFSRFAQSSEQITEMHKMQVIEELDGCKVYRFWDGNYHYITKCGSSVTTQKNWDEYCGKACIQHKREEITTENNQ
jgi:hypothetical protein